MVPRWPGSRRHRGDSGLCTAPSATVGVSSRAHRARSVPGHMSTSSSGQDVALWPRQPRLKSWCGQQLAVIAHRAVCLGGLSPSCMQAVNHERATAERPALSHGCLAVLLGSHTWPGCRRHRGDSGPCTAPPATAGASSRADMARPAVGHMSTSSSGQDVALWQRQPRLKSWCGQQLAGLARRAVYLGGLGPSLPTSSQP